MILLLIQYDTISVYTATTEQQLEIGYMCLHTLHQHDR